MIYLDYAATTPMSESAMDTFVQASRAYFGNEQSLHDVGSHAAALLQTCKRELARLLHGKAQGIYFTGSGSESNYLALHSLITAHAHQGKHIITTPLEHASIRNYFHELKQCGFSITYVPVDSSGVINMKELENILQDDTILVCIQHANSEIGTIQPIADIGTLLKKQKRDILFHVDCVQTFGKIPINVMEMHIDSLAISAHKVYGPKGVGACYINPQVNWKPMFQGTSHESGFRPGTVNVPGIAAFLTAAEDMYKEQTQEFERLHALRNFFIEGLQRIQHPISIEGTSTLPTIVAATIQGIEGQYTMLACNQQQIAISVGSACQVGKQEPSRTLLAIGKTEEEAKQYVRFSFGKYTTKQQLEIVLQTLETMIEEFFKGVN